MGSEDLIRTLVLPLNSTRTEQLLAFSGSHGAETLPTPSTGIPAVSLCTDHEKVPACASISFYSLSGWMARLDASHISTSSLHQPWPEGIPQQKAGPSHPPGEVEGQRRPSASSSERQNQIQAASAHTDS